MQFELKSISISSKTCIIIALITIFQIKSFAQISNFEKVTLKHFINNKYSSSNLVAPAILLNKYRKTHFENKNNKWNAVTEVKRRVKILNKDGLKYCIENTQLIQIKNKKEFLKNIQVIVYYYKNERFKKRKVRKLDLRETWINDSIRKIQLNLSKIDSGSIVDVKYKLISPFLIINDLGLLS